MTSLAIAQFLYTRGLSVIPVPRPHPGGSTGKIPAIPWKDFQTRLPTLDELHQWFSTEQNIAIVTGAISGIVVVDVDDIEARHWWMWHRPYSPWQTQTAKGNHFFYQHPGCTIRNRARLETPDGKFAIDVRGDGGYVISPGSLHASGSTYRAAGDWRRAKLELPVFDPAWLERPGDESQKNGNHLTADFPIGNSAVDIHIRARAYLEKIPKPEIGQGSDRAVFYAACRLVRRFALSDADAEQLLWDWCGNRPGWTREWVSQKISNAHKHGTEQIGAL